ncbi:MAG: alpha/beta fold hydrolase [Actinomycetota bacterium]
MTSRDEARPKFQSEESAQRVVRANGVDLCIETFGDPGDPAILLIGGAAASMDWWEDGFCERLAEGTRFVIRYDFRDTGQSVSYQPGAPPYTGNDLVRDAVGLLDTLGLSRAHVVGISMGGGIAQSMVLDHPDRIASLTLMSTSPVGSEDPDLPPSSEELSALFSNPPPEPDWSDRAAVIDYMVEGERPFEGSHPFDEAHVREIAGRIFDRSLNIASSLTNHWILDGGEDPTGRLGEVVAPTLVIHGLEDPLLPYGHAVALAREIPGAQLLPLEQTGHEYPPRAVWDIVIPAILKHTSRGL